MLNKLNITKPVHFFGLGLVFAMLMWLAWPPFQYTTLLLFVGLIPLLIIHDKAIEQDLSKFKYWLYTYTALFLWNLLTTWWVWYASPAGAVAMLVLNTALMSLPFLAHRYTKQVLGNRTGYLPLVAYWLAYEYLHFNWDIEWPWLTLGNGFATAPDMVQWYEYTGVFGGSLWIWIVNIAIYNLLKGEFNSRRVIKPALIIVSPIIASVFIKGSAFPGIHEKPAEIVIVQPNIDPYTAKFDEDVLTPDEQIEIMLRLAKKKVNGNTEFLLLPETSLMGDLDENYLGSSKVINRLKEFLKDYPNLTMVAGADSYKFYPPGVDKPTITAREYREGSYYDSYNTAFMITDNGVGGIYHKSKLVCGVEKMPYPQLLSFLDNWSADLGGTSGGLGRNKEAEVFTTKDSLSVAPIICYESVFGEYVTDYVRKGASMLFIITNDGWWRNTPGYKQHMHYARLRAIETRRDIARCANTGVSCFIKSDGTVFNETEWWKPAVISGGLLVRSRVTFYTKWGDYIGRLSAFIGVLFLLSVFVRSKTKKHDFLK